MSVGECPSQPQEDTGAVEVCVGSTRSCELQRAGQRGGIRPCPVPLCRAGHATRAAASSSRSGFLRPFSQRIPPAWLAHPLYPGLIRVTHLPITLERQKLAARLLGTTITSGADDCSSKLCALITRSSICPVS